MRTVQCIKLGRELPGLQSPPLKGELGERVYNQVSQQAWDMWMDHAKMIINEFRLNMADAKARAVLRTEMEKYFFEGGASARPPDFVAPTKEL